jgi:hypothetical protein
MELLTKIINEWSNDVAIDRNELALESLNIPKLHSKYLTMFSNARLKLRSLSSKRKILNCDLREYYLGNANDENDTSLLEKLQREPIRYKVLKQDVQSYIDSDNVMIQLNMKVAMQEEIVDVLEEIMKSINTRNFIIKNSIDFMRLELGN